MSRGVGPSWATHRVVGATRAGLAGAKEGVGQKPERYKLVEPGTIFYNPMRILLGSIAFLDEGGVPGITSPDYVVFKTKPGLLHPRWFYYWLRSDAGASFIKTLARGAVRERMLFRRLAAAEIDVPPYDVQCAFARCIPAVERARAAAEAQLEAAKALHASYLQEVFGSSTAQGWSRIRVEQLCESIDYGHSASADFTLSMPRFLRITDIQDGEVDWTTVPGCRISPDAESANSLTDGDIVFARTGATTGKSFLIRKPPRAVFASYLIRLRPSQAVRPAYLYAFFQSNDYWGQVRASTRGGAQPNVNATLLGAITVSLAPLAEQDRVVSFMNETTEDVHRVRTGAVDQLAAIKALPAALLWRAFSGAL